MFAVAAVVYVAFLGKTTGVATQKNVWLLGEARGCGMSHFYTCFGQFKTFHGVLCFRITMIPEWQVNSRSYCS